MHAEADIESSDDRRVVRRALPGLVAGRTAGNILIRFPYVFIDAIARGLGIGVDTATTILGLRELGGLATPAVGHLADRGHERRVISSFAVAAGVTTIAAPFVPGLWWFGALMAVGGLTKFGVDAAQGAWVGHRVPYSRRGRVLGLMEIAWAGAFLLGMPVCAWLIDGWGWKAAFVGTGVVMIVLGVVQRLTLPADHPEVGNSGRIRLRVPRSMVGVMVFAALQPFAQMMVFAVVGDWFVTSLGMSLTGLGLNTMLLGLAELTGTGLAALFADRLGKRRTAMAGLMLGLPLAAVLGFTGGNAAVGVTVLLLMDVGIELAFVAVLPLITELDPDARASAIGLAMAVITLSRATSSILSGLIYVNFGMEAIGLVSAASIGGCLVALWLGVSEPR